MNPFRLIPSKWKKAFKKAKPINNQMEGNLPNQIIGIWKSNQGPGIESKIQFKGKNLKKINNPKKFEPTNKLKS